MELAQYSEVCSVFSSKTRMVISSWNGIDVTYQNIDLSHDSFMFYINLLNPQTIIANDESSRLFEKQQIQAKIIVNKQKDYTEQRLMTVFSKFNPYFEQLEHREHRVKKIIDFQDQQGCRSLSALLAYLFIHNQIPINFNLLSVKFNTDRVKIMASTYEHLDIMKQVIHPSLAKNLGKTKQGYTLLNLYYSKTITAIARKSMLNKFLNPFNNKQKIQERQLGVQYIMKNILPIENQMNLLLKKVYNVNSILKKFDFDDILKEDWRRLSVSLNHILLVKDLVENNQSTDFMPKFIVQIIQSSSLKYVNEISNLINNIVDLKQFQIKPNVYVDLDKRKQQFKNIQSILEMFSIKYSKVFNLNIIVVYIQSIGFLMCTEQFVDLQDWKLQFQERQNKNYYSNQATSKIDEMYGDIKSIISNIEQNIFLEIQNEVKKRKDELCKAYALIGELDCMMAIAKISQSLTKPIISSGTFIIKDGWNLLIDEAAVTNNFFSYGFTQDQKFKMYNSQFNLVNSNYSNRCLLISGPNASGKSLYAKQIGTILFLASIGSFVPAKKCTVPLVDNITAYNTTCSLFHKKHGAREEMFQLNKIFTSLTRRSFVIIDEFGRSCTYFDAERIMYSIIKYLTERQFPQNQNIITSFDKQQMPFLHPLSIVITHMKDLFKKDLTYSPQLRLLKTQVNFGQQIQYLYKLSPGYYSGSHAIDLCQKMGINKDLVEQAREIRDQIQGVKKLNILGCDEKLLQLEQILDCDFKSPVYQKKSRRQNFYKVYQRSDQSRISYQPRVSEYKKICNFKHKNDFNKRNQSKKIYEQSIYLQSIYEQSIQEQSMYESSQFEA